MDARPPFYPSIVDTLSLLVRNATNQVGMTAQAREAQTSGVQSLANVFDLAAHGIAMQETSEFIQQQQKQQQEQQQQSDNGGDGNEGLALGRSSSQESGDRSSGSGSESSHEADAVLMPERGGEKGTTAAAKATVAAETPSWVASVVEAAEASCV
jgi:hypothetical protein